MKTMTELSLAGRYIADLDVAILSLVDDLDAPAQKLAAALDQILKDFTTLGEPHLSESPRARWSGGLPEDAVLYSGEAWDSERALFDQQSRHAVACSRSSTTPRCRQRSSSDR